VVIAFTEFLFLFGIYILLVHTYLCHTFASQTSWADYPNII